jgi:hypothetical protein
MGKSRFISVLFFIFILFSAHPVSIAAQTDPGENIFTIKVAGPTSPKDVQVRYSLNKSLSVLDSTAKPDDDQIVVKTANGGRVAKSFRAIIYAPGCQFSMVSVDDLSASNRQGEFACQKLGTTSLRGRVDISKFAGRNLKIEVLYSFDWAGKFFGLRGFSISPISLASASVEKDGTFAMELPDFGGDPSWDSVSHQAKFLLQLLDQDSIQALGTLWTPEGYLKVAASYPEEIQFTTERPILKKSR